MFNNLKINLINKKRNKSLIHYTNIQKQKKTLFSFFMNWKMMFNNNHLKKKILQSLCKTVALKNVSVISQSFNNLILNMESQKFLEQTKNYTVNKKKLNFLNFLKIIYILFIRKV